jgi:RHS repeat-associated protein
VRVPIPTATGPVRTRPLRARRADHPRTPRSRWTNCRGPHARTSRSRWTNCRGPHTGYPALGGAPAETVTTTYDSLGAPTTLKGARTYQDGATFDSLNRLTGRTLGANPGSGGSASGIWASRTYGYSTVRGRLAEAYLTRHKTVGGADTADVTSHLTYGFDPANTDIHSVLEDSPADPAAAEKQCFGYDRRGQLATAGTAATSSNCVSVDPHIGRAGYSGTWTFDALHRLKTASTVRDITGSSTDQTQTLTYGYDAAGANPASGPVTVTGLTGGDLTLSYDPAGTGRATGYAQAGTSAPPSRTFSYDYAGRIAAVSRGGTSSTGSAPGTAGTTATYTYDGAGALWRRKDAAGTTYYLGADQIFLPDGQTGATAATRTRTYAIAGTVIATRTTTPTTTPDGTGTWTLNDTQASPAYDIDWTTGATTRRAADPYGAIRNGQPTPTTAGAGTTTPALSDTALAGFATRPGQAGFLGQIEDPTTNLDLLGARTYDPTLGLFLQPDPLTDPTNPGMLSAYLYAEANPIGFTDPSGLCSVVVGGKRVCGGSSSPDTRTGRRVGHRTHTVSTVEPDDSDLLIPSHVDNPLDMARQQWADGRRAGPYPTPANMGNDDGVQVAAVVVLALPFVVAGGVACLVGCTVAGALTFAADMAIGAADFAAGGSLGAGAAAAGTGMSIRMLLEQRAASRAATAGNEVAAAATNTAVKVCANSFTGDTLVLMADGTRKPIKDVELGDEVMATDPETGETGPRKVIDLIRHGGLHTMVAVRLSDGSTIDATDGHPFWVESRGEWVDAIDLRSGDVVVTANGARLTVASLGISEQDLTAYNLTVEGLHTYYAGGDSVLVHNAGCANITEAGLAHSFDRHAAQWFGGQPTKAGQMAEWQGLIERTAGSSKVVPWSSGSTLTNAHIARIDGKYFVAQFDRGSGDLVTAFVPKNDQLSAMLRLLGQ